MRIPTGSATSLDKLQHDLDVAIVGGGPAGLMAAETARAAGLSVCVFERMGSCGRKFLIAGKGGLNLTHSEAEPTFSGRYSAGAAQVKQWLAQFGPQALRDWALGLQVPTVVGSSGRVFPHDLKAAPLMRGWLRRLRASGVQFAYAHYCTGIARHGNLWALEFAGDVRTVHAKAVVFALGGGSWAKLGSDGSWITWLADLVPSMPLVPSNCGFVVHWSEHVKKHAGAPLKPVVATVNGYAQRGEIMVSEYGLEGSLMYALSHRLRAQFASGENAAISLDLCPDIAAATLLSKLQSARTGLSLSEKLKRVAHLSPAKIALLLENWPERLHADAAQIVQRVKQLNLPLHAMRDIDEAISTAGGVQCAALDERLMAPALPGVFFAGEMLDWDAPTGGYLLSACFASGFVAGRGVVDFVCLGKQINR